mgnify:CR=1 FL=1
MKKLLLLVIAFNLITSCSSDENSSSEQQDSTLPKTISYTYSDRYLGMNSINILTYNGNKIVSSIKSGSKTIFTYTGDVIAKQEVFDVDEKGKEIKTKEVNYTYENGKLITRVSKAYFTTQYPDGTSIDKTVYTHASNEFISFIRYAVDIDTKVETKRYDGSFTYADGNLMKYIAGSSIYIYEYDTKKNPLKNVLGFNLLLDEIREMGKNNATKISYKPISGSDANYLKSYIYNEKDYPTKHTSYAHDGSIEFIIDYTY